MSSELAGRGMIPTPGAGERRTAARGVAWSGMESGVAALVGLLLTPLVVQKVGIESLGLWGAAWSLAHAASLLDLGIGASYGRFAARAIARHDSEELNGTVSAGLTFHLCLSALVALVAFTVGPRILEWIAPKSPYLATARVVLACTLTTVLLRTTLSAYRGVVTGAQRIDLLGKLGSIATAVEGAGAAALLALGCGLEGMAWNSLFLAAVLCMSEAIAAHRLCPELRVRPFRRGRHYRTVLSFALRLQVTRAAEILAAHTPRLALALGPGLLAAGAYDLGARIARAVSLCATLPLRIVLPLASRLEARGDRERLRALVERATRYVGLLAVPGVAFVLLDAGPILSAWTGTELPAGASASARLLALGMIVTFLAAPTRLALRGVGHPGIEATSTAGGALLNLLLAITFAIPFGATGVAAAFLIASVGSLVILRVACMRRRTWPELWPTPRAIAGPLLAGATALLTGIAARNWVSPAQSASRWEIVPILLQHGALLLAVFFLAGLVLRAIRNEDLALLKEMAGPEPAGGGR